MKKIIVIGSLNMDLVTRVKLTPKIGETVLGNGLEKIPGGKGANQAVAIGRLKGNVSLMGLVGDDKFGKQLVKNLIRNNVDCERVAIIQNQPTGTALIMVNEDGDNSIVVIPGANYELKPMHIKADIFDSYDYLLAQLETPVETIEEAFKEAKNRVLFTVLNPAPAQKLSKELISNIDLLVPNETEFELLTNQPANDDGIIKGAEYLFSLGLKALMITLGKEGVYYLDSNNKFYRSKAYDVEVVDTTAAGDSFIGGFMTEISKGETIESAIEFAMIAGAITITRLGAQSSLPDIALLEKFKGKKELDNFQKNDC